METRASYLLVGTFVLTFFLGLIVFVVWLAKFQFDTTLARYDIYFSGSVTGLKDGSPVRYSGVRVGEVVFIGLDREHPDRVRALIEVEAITPVTENTVASLEFEGLTGGRYILLSGGTSGAAPLTAEEGQNRPEIPSRYSQLESLLQGAPHLIEGATALLAQANVLLGSENRGNIAAILKNFGRFSATLSDNEQEFGQLIKDSAETMASLKHTAAQLDGLAASLGGDAKRLVDRADTSLAALEQTVVATRGDVVGLLKELRGSAKAFTGMSNEIRGLVAENREEINAFTGEGLYELTTLLTEARNLLTSLNRVTTQVERDPARFLFGNQQQGYEARGD